MRTFEWVVDHAIVANAQAVIDRRNDVAGSQRATGRERAGLVARTVNQTLSEAAADQHQAVAEIPVIAACIVGIDLRCATEVSKDRN